MRTPALSRRTGARVASWVLLGPWLRRARFSGARARVKQCLALWKAKLVRRPWSVGDCTMNRCWPNTNTGNAKLAAAGTLWHVTHALISESLPLLFVSSSGFSEPQAVSRSVVHEHGRDLQRARRLSAADVPVLNTLDFLLCRGFELSARRAMGSACRIDSA